MKKKLAYFVQFPIHYQAPLLARLAREVDLKVFFLSDMTTRAFKDKGFGEIKWDADLTAGYEHAFLPNWRDTGGYSFWNPLVRGLGQALDEQPWDAVWFHGYAQFGLLRALRAAFSRKIPVLFRSESNRICVQPHPARDAIVRWIVRNASGLLCVGSLNRQYYLHHGARREQLFHVPYAVDNEALQEAVRAARPRVRELRSEIGAADGVPVVIFASKIMERKNPLLLLEAFAALPCRDSAPPGMLVYVGDGPQRPELEARIEALGMGQWVKVVGFKNQSELPSWFAMADLFVLPSRREPFAMVVNEAMNAGLPVIATDEVGAAADLVRDGENGYVVRANDEPSMQIALSKALADPVALGSMGAGSVEIIDRWSYEDDIRGVMTALDACQST